MRFDQYSCGSERGRPWRTMRLLWSGMMGGHKGEGWMEGGGRGREGEEGGEPPTKWT